MSPEPFPGTMHIFKSPTTWFPILSTVVTLCNYLILLLSLVLRYILKIIFHFSLLNYEKPVIILINLALYSKKEMKVIIWPCFIRAITYFHFNKS